MQKGTWVCYQPGHMRLYLQIEDQDLALYEVSGSQGGQVNRSGSCYTNPTGHFEHLFAEVYNILSGFVCEPHFLQGLIECADGGRVYLLLILVIT